MAIRKLDKSFVPSTKEISYLNKTFPQWKQSLIDFAKVYYPQTYTDFNESSPGTMFIEMGAYIGDVLSYYMDSQFKENLMQYAEEPRNILAISQAFGFKPKPSTAAFTDANFYQICPAADITQNYQPDARYFLRLAPNAVVTSNQYPGVSFRTTAELNFADPQDREITIYAVDGSNKPLTYLVKKAAKIVAGTIKTYTVSFGSPQKFSKITLPEQNILEILSLTDSNGNTWYEVDYLAQDVIFVARDNVTPVSGSNQSTYPTYLLNPQRTARRFITRYNENFELEVHFGSGIIDDTDALINLEPNKIASDEYQTNVGSTSLDPSDFLSSKSYGLSPSNVNITITYSVGGGLQSNVPSNSINKIRTVQILTDRNQFVAPQRALFDDVVSSLAVNNSNPASGGKDTDTIEEIRQSSLAFFNAQNRLVTSEDYAARVMAMPPKYGAAAKVFVVRDDQINNILRNTNQLAPIGGVFAQDNVGQNIINMYLLGYNQQKKLVNLNDQVKLNIKAYLENYKILTDDIRLLDGFVVNIGVNFRVSTFKNFNMNEVLARCIDSIKNFFDIDRWQINQPIIMNDLFLEIASIDGVQSVLDLEIVNKYAFKNGSDYENFIYDIPAATKDGIVYPSIDPAIFELRYPEIDIVGSATQ